MVQCPCCACAKLLVVEHSELRKISATNDDCPASTQYKIGHNLIAMTEAMVAADAVSRARRSITQRPCV